MWPECLRNLTPFTVALGNLPPGELVAEFQRCGWSEPPLRMVALLGVCRTHQYRECPNLPEWHIENAADEGDDYLQDIGKYYWCDFDLIDRNGAISRLRMTYNEGDADCNDGTWGVVWNRDTAEIVANLMSVGDCEGRIASVEGTLADAYTPHRIPVPIDNRLFDTCMLPFTLVFASDTEFECLVSAAMRWCQFHSHANE